MPYLTGKGGSETLTAHAAREDQVGAGEQLLAQLQSLNQELQDIDSAMEMVGSALQRAQPPMYGRFAIRWWKLYGGAPREPVLIRETGGPGGLLKPDLVKTRGARQRTDGGFGLNADVAREALDAYWLLKHQRKTVQAELAQITRILGRERAGRREAATHLGQRGRELEEEARRRLVAVGAVVVQATDIPIEEEEF